MQIEKGFDIPDKDLKKGYYQHYKGNIYKVIDIARHSETEEYFVVYQQCYEDYSLWIRPIEMFCETVLINDIPKPRFCYLSDHKENEKARSKQDI